MITTKACWECGDTHLVLFSSTKEKICSACGLVMPWELSEGQKPLVGSSRDKRKIDEGE